MIKTDIVSTFHTHYQMLVLRLFPKPIKNVYTLFIAAYLDSHQISNYSKLQYFAMIFGSITRERFLYPWCPQEPVIRATTPTTK